VANEERVKLLKQGVAEWNAWRKESHAGSRPRANLTGAVLSGANLTHADLVRANLNDADLSDAYLSGAYLGQADLSRANLTHADLTDAVPVGADLTGADLSRADLTFANLTGAVLSGANLTSAALLETVFVNVDLTGAIGLETCIHHGPSTIDHRTLQRSGPLPLSFLRGVGLPERMIEYLPSLLNQAIQHYSCFISYASKDQEFADRIYAGLQNKGVRCWFAPHDLRIGAQILDGIDAAIRLRDKVLLILSEHAINSDWVEIEVK
jgi:TIR domain/Pentapeptide repeats (8 copies)